MEWNVTQLLPLSQKMLRGDEAGLDPLPGEERQPLAVERPAVLDPPGPLATSHLGCER